MSTIINQPPPLHQYGLLWVATPSATFHEYFLDQRLLLWWYVFAYAYVNNDIVYLYEQIGGASRHQTPEGRL